MGEGNGGAGQIGGAENGRGNGGGKNDRANGGAPKQTSKWEWVAAAVSAVLVFGAIGFLVYEAVAVPKTPPAVVVQVDSVVVVPNGHLVELRVRNDGGSTAAALKVSGELRDGERVVESSETTIDYVPAFGMRRAGLYFTLDPRRYRLELRPVGYDSP